MGIRVIDGEASADDFCHPIHEWFELSYAQYLTVPRSIMEAMPVEWQRQMTQLLTELDDTFNWRPNEGRYWVELRDANGRYRVDPLREYRHPDWDYIESIQKNGKTERPKTSR